MAITADRLELRGQEPISAKCSIEASIGNACPIAQNPYESRDMCLQCIPRIEQSREYQPERTKFFRFSVTHEVCGNPSDLMFISRGDFLPPHPLRTNPEGQWETYCDHCQRHFSLAPIPMENLFPGFDEFRILTHDAQELTLDLHCIRASRPPVKGAVTNSRQRAIDFYVSHYLENPTEEESARAVDERKLAIINGKGPKIEAEILTKLTGLERQIKAYWEKWKEENDQRFPKSEKRLNKPPLPAPASKTKTLYP